MKLEPLQHQLIAAARTIPADDRVPYAFEKRIMARLRSLSPVDALALWSRGLWRAAISCVAVTLLAALWAVWAGFPQPELDLAQAFETAVFTSTSPDEVW